MVERKPVRLDQFLKLHGIVDTGGHAKLVIQNGEVLVNGELETKRRRKLANGDLIHFQGSDYQFQESALEH